MKNKKRKDELVNECHILICQQEIENRKKGLRFWEAHGKKEIMHLREEIKHLESSNHQILSH